MISTVFAVTSTIVILTVLAAVSGILVRRYLKVRGPRVVTCPADNSRAAVTMDAVHGALRGTDDLRLNSCSHWPERRTCGQGCLQQIETSPDGCLVRNLLTNWYANKSCVLCGKAFEQIDWLEHKPGLMNPQQITTDWSHVPAQELYGILETHVPVCWNCHIAMTFRREYPELVTDRPWKRQ